MNGTNNKIFALAKADKPIAIPARASLLYEKRGSTLRRRKSIKAFRNVDRNSISRSPSWMMNIS